ncbi:hypothetical protein [Comamonas endophytica]|uniref:Uncharacterized protein n=1 Tax=Comamonas endophytica TaxID=2949090 RepID=A0ABY6G930_9BURK|nr:MULTISPECIES: hypothetical protein [unclassified Acidovorax]MCD2511694.1 hypothetical protein [Acidovorax sp. D4N7]UYG51423.1 hypothetical protein M9799_15380 [Acidovorax sp. 5MLIR]
MEKSVKDCVHEMISYDDARVSAPYEHETTALLGLGLLMCALRAPGRGRAVLHATLAGILFARAASGTDGLRKWANVPRP